MLDSRAELLLEYINNYCGSGYKIVTIKQMLVIFPQYLKIDQEQLEHIIKTLVNGDYILIKYADQEQYCIYCLPKGKSYLEDKNLKKQTDSILKTQVVKLVFFSSLVGSILGGIIISLFNLIVKLC